MSCILNEGNFIVSVSCHGGVHKPTELELVFLLVPRSFFSEMSSDTRIVSVDTSLDLIGD